MTPFYGSLIFAALTCLGVLADLFLIGLGDEEEVK